MEPPGDTHRPVSAPRPVGTIWTYDLAQPVPDLAPQIEAVFRRVGPESPGVLAGAPLLATEIARRFAEGRKCYTAWVGDRLAAYGWVSFREEYVGELQMHLVFQPCEAYIWDCFTLPDFRQKGLYAALLVYILNQLRADSVCTAWIGADFDNIPSQRGIDRAGFVRVADLVVSLVHDRLLAEARGYPGVPESLVAEARRVFMGSREQVWMSTQSPDTGG